MSRRTGPPGHVRRTVALATLCAFLPACGGIVPERLTSTTDLFGAAGPSASADIPKGGRKSIRWKAPAKAVFRAATMAVSQARWIVASIDPEKGVILAYLEGTVKDRPTWAAQTEWKIRRSFAIVIREAGATETEVEVLAKAQQQCMQFTVADYLGATFFTLGIALFVIPDLARHSSACEVQSVPHWATEADGNEGDINQVLTLTYNNLINAGAL